MKCMRCEKIGHIQEACRAKIQQQHFLEGSLSSVTVSYGDASDLVSEDTSLSKFRFMHVPLLHPNLDQCVKPKDSISLDPPRRVRTYNRRLCVRQKTADICGRLDEEVLPQTIQKKELSGTEKSKSDLSSLVPTTLNTSRPTSESEVKEPTANCNALSDTWTNNLVHKDRSTAEFRNSQSHGTHNSSSRYVPAADLVSGMSRRIQQLESQNTQLRTDSDKAAANLRATVNCMQNMITKMEQMSVAQSASAQKSADLENQLAELRCSQDMAARSSADLLRRLNEQSQTFEFETSSHVATFQNIYQNQHHISEAMKALCDDVQEISHSQSLDATNCQPDKPEEQVKCDKSHKRGKKKSTTRTSSAFERASSTQSKEVSGLFGITAQIPDEEDEYHESTSPPRQFKMGVLY